jgi:pimeloyl-ACP methyl ester carboxylesterase
MDPAALRGYLDAWTGTDLHDRIDGRTLPVLAVVGEHDPAYPVARVAGTWGRWYPNCELERLTGCGHYPMDEAPAELAALLEKHLDDAGA